MITFITKTFWSIILLIMLIVFFFHWVVLTNEKLWELFPDRSTKHKYWADAIGQYAHDHSWVDKL